VSLDFVSIQVAVKKAYGFRMDLEELPKQNLVTVGDFAKYLASLQHAQTKATVNDSPAPS
jgi:acyl carrier protein